MRHLPTTNGNWATGEAIKLVKKLGAWVDQLEWVQIHPTGLVDPKNLPFRLDGEADDGDQNVVFLGPEALRGHGGILINPYTAKRFVNELGRRDEVTQVIFKDCQPTNAAFTPTKKAFSHLPNTAYLILSQEAVTKFDEATIRFYKSKGFFFELQGTAGLADFIGCDENVIKQELEAYNTAFELGKDDFGKKVFPTICPLNDTYRKGFFISRVFYILN